MVKINALKNGPLVIEAEGKYVMMKNGREEPIDQKALALCRCGASANKPFCDGSHKTINFEADGGECRIK